MTAKIICQNITKEEIKIAFNLGKYQKSDIGVYSIPYKVYEKADTIWIEFEEQFDFCQMLFVIADIFETAKNKKRDVLGFVKTNKSNKITEYLNDERVCLYLSDRLKSDLNTYEESYVDSLDIVAESNKNYLIVIDSLFSYNSNENKRFDEPQLNLSEYKLIKENEYLYEKEDFEHEYIEDLKLRNRK